MNSINAVGAQQLGELLRQAKDVLPLRVTYAGFHLAQVRFEGVKRNVEYGNSASYVWLEAACREEFDLRGWQWSIARENQQSHSVTVRTGRGEFGVHFGHVPLALNMLQALLNALAGER